MAHRDWHVLDAAILVDDEITRMLEDRKRFRLIHRAQLADSSHSVPSNIAEAIGRDLSVADRNKSLRHARGEANETIRHLHTNNVARRLDTAVFRRLKSRLVTIQKMIDSITGD